MGIHQDHSHDRMPQAGAGSAALQPRNEAFILGGWHVQPTHHSVTDGRETRQLEPRLMTLLCLLASRPGDVLSRDALMEALWPRVVVNENSLTRAISDLRRILQDGSEAAFIETVPKRGYKLVAPVASCRAGVTATQQRPAGGPQPRRDVKPDQERGIAQWLQRHATALAAMNITLAIAVVSSFSPFMLSAERTMNTEQDIVTRFTADVSQGSPSDETVRGPRGEFTSHDAAQTYLPTMASPGMSATDSDRQNANLAVSPDGGLVAFTRRTDEGSSLLIGSLPGNRDPLQVYSSQHRIDHLHWSPVGTALLFSVLPAASHATLDQREDEGRLMLFDLQTLSIRELYRSGRDPGDMPGNFNDALNIT